MTEIDDEQPRVPPLSSPPPAARRSAGAHAAECPERPRSRAAEQPVSEDTDETPGDPFEGWPASESSAVIEESPPDGVERRARARRGRRPERLHGARGHAARQPPLGRRRRLALQRRRDEPDAPGRARRAHRSGRLAGRDHRDAGARRIRAAARRDGAREDAPLRVHRRARRGRARRDAALRLRRAGVRLRACSWPGSRPGCPSRSASSRSTRSSRPRPGSRRRPTPSARRSRWPTCSPGSGPAPAPSRYNPARNVEDLRNLWQEAVVRQPSLALDGRHEAALGPEPAARSRSSSRAPRSAPTSAPVASRATKSSKRSSSRRNLSRGFRV